MEGSLLGAAARRRGLFLLFQCCGAAVAWAALPGESGGVRLLLGSVCGTVMLQWFPVPFAFLLGFTLPAHGCAAALALLCAGLCLWAGRRKGLPPLQPAQALLAFRRRKGLWLALGLWLFACWLVCRSFRWEEGAVYSSQATYGDMSMHLSFITSLARQGDFPPDYSLLPGHPLCYPFLGGQRLRFPALVWRAPDLQLRAAHVVRHGPGGGRLSPVRRQAAGELGQGDGGFCPVLF